MTRVTFILFEITLAAGEDVISTNMPGPKYNLACQF
jgi:hypothetical protein